MYGKGTVSQAVSRWPLTVEARFRVHVGFVVEETGTGTRFSPNYSSISPVNIIPPWLPIFIHNLGYEQQTRWWPQFRDIISPHRHEQLYCCINGCSGRNI
jgi:hypothetical protein